MDDEDKPFEGILGNSSEINVLEYLLSSPNFSFNITELSDILDISRTTLTKIINRLLHWEMISIEKQIGNIKLYKLNTNSKLITDMEIFSNDIIYTIEEREFTPNPDTYYVFSITKVSDQSKASDIPSCFNAVETDVCNIKKNVDCVV